MPILWKPTKISAIGKRHWGCDHQFHLSVTVLKCTSHEANLLVFDSVDKRCVNSENRQSCPQTGNLFFHLWLLNSFQTERPACTSDVFMRLTGHMYFMLR